MFKSNWLVRVVSRNKLKKIDHYIAIGSYIKAEEALTAIIKKDQNNLKALIKYAQVANLRNEWHASVKRWEKVITVAEVSKRTKLKRAHEKLDKARFNYAKELYEAGQLNKAKEYLTKVISTKPEHLKALVMLAEISTTQRIWFEAFMFWKQTVMVAEESGEEIPNSKLFNLKHFIRFFRAGLLKEINNNYVEEVQNYWLKHYGKIIDPSLHVAYYNLTGKKDPRIIPRVKIWNEIYPVFNDKRMRPSYSDKNIYDQLFNTSKTAITVLKRVRGSYFDSNNNNLSAKDAFCLLLDHKTDFIIKPSKTDNGEGIRKLYYKNSNLYLENKKIQLKELDENYGADFIVQEVLKQHSVMAAPHPESVNTLRIVTFRWKNRIIHLMTFARFGTDGSVRDNAGTGGLCCGINDSGKFMDFAIDENAIKYSYHPTTNYCFKSDVKIPNYEHFIKFALDLHQDVLHFDIISWDIVVGIDCQPIFLEANYKGAIWLYQLSTQKPLFGDYTEEVLQYLRNLSMES